MDAITVILVGLNGKDVHYNLLLITSGKSSHCLLQVAENWALKLLTHVGGIGTVGVVVQLVAGFRPQRRHVPRSDLLLPNHNWQTPHWCPGIKDGGVPVSVIREV